MIMMAVMMVMMAMVVMVIAKMKTTRQLQQLSLLDNFLRTRYYSKSFTHLILQMKTLRKSLLEMSYLGQSNKHLHSKTNCSSLPHSLLPSLPQSPATEALSISETGGSKSKDEKNGTFKESSSIARRAAKAAATNRKEKGTFGRSDTAPGAAGQRTLLADGCANSAHRPENRFRS